MVGETGVEPAWLAPRHFKCLVYTNSTTRPIILFSRVFQQPAFDSCRGHVLLSGICRHTTASRNPRSSRLHRQPIRTLFCVYADGPPLHYHQSPDCAKWALCSCFLAHSRKMTAIRASLERDQRFNYRAIYSRHQRKAIVTTAATPRRFFARQVKRCREPGDRVMGASGR